MTYLMQNELTYTHQKLEEIPESEYEYAIPASLVKEIGKGQNAYCAFLFSHEIDGEITSDCLDAFSCEKLFYRIYADSIEEAEHLFLMEEDVQETFPGMKLTSFDTIDCWDALIGYLTEDPQY